MIITITIFEMLGLAHYVTEMSTRKYSLGGKARKARKAKNLTAICEPIVCTMIQNISQTCRPPRPVTGWIPFLFCVDDVRTSQETQAMGLDACYGILFRFYV
jgi:hypothetical protein